jgi:hypothetical protein
MHDMPVWQITAILCMQIGSLQALLLLLEAWGGLAMSTVVYSMACMLLLNLTYGKHAGRFIASSCCCWRLESIPCLTFMACVQLSDITDIFIFGDACWLGHCKLLLLLLLLLEA